MQHYDIERAKTQAKLIAVEVSKIFGTGESEDADYSNDPSVEVW